MPIDKYTQQAEQALKELWDTRTMGVATPALQWEQMLTPSALTYLRQRYPFLQIINSEATFEETVIPEFKKVQTGWVIHDYGEAMSTSRGDKLFDSEQGDDGGGTGSGGGTLVWQSIETAQAMIAMAIAKGWAGVELVAGSELMQFAAWMAAQDKGWELVGYVASARDQQKRERIKNEKAVPTAAKTFNADEPQLSND